MPDSSYIIRADGSSHLGLGHIYRSLALADGLKKHGLEAVFITRQYERRVSDIITRRGYDVRRMPADSDFREDLALTLDYAKATRLVFNDLWNTDITAHLNEYRDYLYGLKASGKFLVTIVGMNDSEFPSDIVINMNYGADRRSNHASGPVRYLNGPDYFVFRQEFIEAAGKKREIRKQAKNILVTMGGSDILGLNSKIARALCHLEDAGHLHLRMVLGLSAGSGTKLRETLKGFNGAYDLLDISDCMADLMLWADLAITAGGLTKYEAAVTGTPCIIISQVDHQVELARDFARGGAALDLGPGSSVSEDSISQAVQTLLKDDARRAQMSEKGRQMVDGKGIERIFACIPPEAMQ